MSYLDNTGLAYFWTKIKAYVSSFLTWANIQNKPSTFAPSAHSHGNITNAGELGTASRAVVTDGNKKVSVSSVTSTELGYLSGVTSSVQTQLNGKANSSAIPTIPSLSRTISGSGNAITDITVSGHAITATKGTTFLTSHQDISGKVDKSGDTMTGNLTISKTSPRIETKNTAITRGTSPFSDTNVIEVLGKDRVDKSTWALYHRYATDKAHKISLICYNGLTTDTQYAEIGVGYDASGNWVTNAPTPGTADSSTKIATTAFVKAQGYVTENNKVRQVSASGNVNRPILVRYNQNDASETDNYAAYNGNITINTNTGVITTFGSHLMKRSGVTKGTNPSSTQYWTLTFGDKDGGNYTDNCIGMLETSLSSTGVVKTYIRAMKNAAATATPCELAVIYDTANNIGYTQAPTPATSDDSTKIATTAFVKAQGYITSSGNTTGSSGSCTGNAATATKLATARTINGVSFDGSASITVADSTKLPLAGGTLTGNVIQKFTDYERGVSTTAYTRELADVKDKNNVRFALIETLVAANKSSKTCIFAYKTTTTSGNSIGSLGIGCDANGNVYTIAPTPATADSSTKIATTAFVKAQGYLTSHQSLANYVTLNSSQEITGDKKFSWFCSKSNVIDRTVGNTTDDQWLISGGYQDKNGKSLIDVGFHRKDQRHWSLRLYDTSGTQRWMMFQGINHDGTSPYVSVGGDFHPMDNGDKYCGLSDRRWKAVYAVNGAIQTSDERIKDDIDKLPEAVLDAWDSIEWLQFRMKPSVEKKGSSARLHSGIIAQRARDAFISVGLDASDYGFFCWDQWDKTPAMLDEKGEVAIPEMPAGDQYSIRYDEALAIEAAYQRRENARLKRRIADLEERLAALELKIS